MRNLLLIIILAIFANYTFSQNYNQPESVTYDATSQKYYISNKGSGEIITKDSSGNLAIFCKPDNSIRGLHILNGFIFAAGDKGLIKINLSNAQIDTIFAITGRIFLNDVESNGIDKVYVSDTNANKIFQLDLTNNSITTLLSNITAPNGMLYDSQNNRLLICSWSGKWIKSLNLENNQLETLYTTTFSSLDGLAMDQARNIYLSSWGTNSVYKFVNFSSDPVVFQSGFSGPADIYCNKMDNILAVPNFNSNTVDFINLPTVDINENINSPKIQTNNSPNPFSFDTDINFVLDKDGIIKIEIFNIKGELIKTFSEKKYSKGKHTIKFDSKDLNSGLYFYRISDGKNVLINNKMLKIK